MTKEEYLIRLEMDLVSAKQKRIEQEKKKNERLLKQYTITGKISPI